MAKAMKFKTPLQRAVERKPVAACRWFLRCDAPATTTVEHSILGPVPCCAKCAKFATGGRS